MARQFNIEKEYRKAEALHAAGKNERAGLIYANLRKQRPANPYALDLFGVLANRNRMFDAAVTLLRAAVRCEPDNIEMNYHLALALRNQGQLDEAGEYYTKVMSMASPTADKLHNYADLLLEQGELSAAETHYRHALELDASWLPTWHKIAETCIRQGRHAEAVPFLEHCLQLDANHIPALSLLSIALAVTGEHERLDELTDMQALIRPQAARPVPAFPNLQDFNRQLADYICRHPGLKADIHGISTRQGGQTEGNLFDDPHPLISALREMIDTTIQAYIGSLPNLPAHPHCGQVPKQWRLEAWGVVLQSGGRQAAHVHFDGWASCVYYVSLPSAIRGDDPRQAGWIQFGHGPEEMYGGTVPPIRRVQPMEGNFVMFPSYLWHETIPFESEEPRICIAFDVIPTTRRRPL